MDAAVRSTVSKLVANASTRKQGVSEAAMNSLREIARLHADVVFDATRSLVFQTKEAPSERSVLVYLELFSLTHSACERDGCVSVFLTLQRLLATSRKKEILDKWDEVCQGFITSSDVAEAVCQSEIDCSAVLVTLVQAAKYAADFVASRYESVGSSEMFVNPRLFTRVATEVAKNATKGSPFFSACFVAISNFFVENPRAELLEAITLIYERIAPSPCPVRSGLFVAKLCEIGPSLESSMVTSLLELLPSLVFDVEIMKKVIDFILNLMQSVHVKETLRIEHEVGFPVNAMEMPPSCGSPMFSVCLSTIVKLCKKMPELVLTVLLSSFDNAQRSVGYMALSHLLRQTTLSKEQSMMVLYSATAATGKRFYNLALSQLCLDIMQLLEISEREVIALVSYVAEGAIVIRNAHYLMQVVSTDEAHLLTVFNLLADFLFDESKVSLMPALTQALHLLSIRIAGENGSAVVDATPELALEAEDLADSKTAHPLVKVFLKRSISEKSFYLLRMLSSLMSIGALHPFVPAMLSNFEVFFEAVFPLAFAEIKVILDSATRCINSSSEFPSLVMSLLSNIMKLLNDRQFHISLCSGIIHEVEQNLYTKHTQNCLEIFGTIEPFLPKDVASANITKLFHVVPFDDPNIVETFAGLFGTISGNNYALMVPILQQWAQMKTNTGFLVGAGKIPIPYVFICTVLGNVVREMAFDTLIQEANGLLLKLLESIIRKKDVPPSAVLTTLNELSMRLGFQRLEQGKFVLKGFDMFLKYIIQTIGLFKQPQIQKKCVTGLRLLIQVPPCITPKDLPSIAEKVLASDFLQSWLTNPHMFSELRSLILALICVMPDVHILCFLLKTIVPFSENAEVLSLVWRLVSLYHGYAKGEDSVIKFFRPVKGGKIDSFLPLITDLLAASYSDCSEAKYALTAICLMIQIDRGVPPKQQDTQSIFEILDDHDVTEMIGYTLATLRRCRPYFYPNYTHVLSILWSFKADALNHSQIGALIDDILTEKITSSPDLIQKLLLADPKAFFTGLLRVGVNERSMAVVSKTLMETKCVECLSVEANKCILRLFQEPQKVLHIISLFKQMMSLCEIPQFHLFHMTCSLIVLGIAVCEFSQVSGLFVKEILPLTSQCNIPPCPKLDMVAFGDVWQSVLHTIQPETSSETAFTATSIQDVIRNLIELNESLLIDVFNIVMSEVDFANPILTSSVCLFSGEIVLQMKTYSASSRLFTLCFSAMLSFGQLSDDFTCICCLNELTKLLQKPRLTASTFPTQSASMILQVMLKRCTVESKLIIDAIPICLAQFCETFSDGIDEKLTEPIFTIIVESLRQTQFDTEITFYTVLEALLKNEHITDQRYKALYQILRMRPLQEPIPDKHMRVDKSDEKDYSVVLTLFLESNTPWMVCCALAFLRNLAHFFLPAFATRIMDLIDSPNDEVAESAEQAIVLVLGSDTHE